jgi:hypothetical protein
MRDAIRACLAMLAIALSAPPGANGRIGAETNSGVMSVAASPG